MPKPPMIYRVLFQQQGLTVSMVSFDSWNDMTSAIAKWFRNNPERRARAVFIHHIEA